jgi:hypothetical protein
MSVHIWITRRYIPQDGNIQNIMVSFILLWQQCRLHQWQNDYEWWWSKWLGNILRCHPRIWLKRLKEPTKNSDLIGQCLNIGYFGTEVLTAVVAGRHTCINHNMKVYKIYINQCFIPHSTRLRGANATLHPGIRAPSNHWIGGWMDAAEKRKFLHCWPIGCILVLIIVVY